MSSKVAIINAAFLLLGADPVNNLGDSAPQPVKKAIDIYDIYYPSLLTRYAWRFALTQFPLVRVSDFDEIPGYNYAFQLPNDYLEIYKLSPMANYEIYGQLLYTSILPTDLKLFYTAYVSEENLPVYYVEYLVEKFAELFAMPITQQPQLMQLWGESAKEKLNRAIMLDSQQQPSLIVTYNPLGQAKFAFNVGY